MQAGKKNYPVIRLDVYALQMEQKISYQNTIFMVLSQANKFSFTVSQKCPFNDVDIYSYLSNFQITECKLEYHTVLLWLGQNHRPAMVCRPKNYLRWEGPLEVIWPKLSTGPIYTRVMLSLLSPSSLGKM